MENSKVDKNLIFDKILVNTYSKCIKRIDLPVAHEILSTNLVAFFNSTYNYAIEIYPEEYKFSSNPSFNENERKILQQFYGV